MDKQLVETVGRYARPGRTMLLLPDELIPRQSEAFAVIERAIRNFTIALPPLRDCQDDIMQLADFYLRHYNQEFHKQVKRFDASAQKEMRVHSWSGNIRELKHVVRVAVLKSRGEIITPKELDFDTPNTGAHIQFKLKIDDEKSKITSAIVHANGNLTQAANLLGISHRTLWEKRKKYGLI